MNLTRLLFSTFYLLLLISSASFAHNNQGQCTYPKGLGHGLNLTDYHHCQAALKTCSKNGPYPDNNCIEKKLAQEKSCGQLSVLASHINASPALIHIKNVANFNLIDVSFPADGAHQYAILSPQGCLIDTIIDPRDINSNIREEYANNNFYLEAKSAPSYRIEPDNTQVFTINTVALNECRACKKIATAQIAFHFSKDAKWLDTKLVTFKKQSA